MPSRFNPPFSATRWLAVLAPLQRQKSRSQGQSVKPHCSSARSTAVPRPLPAASARVHMPISALRSANPSGPAVAVTGEGAADCDAACGAGETTEFLRQSQILWDAWPDARRPVDGPLFIPGRDHFTIQLDHADAGSDLTLATLALF